MNGIPELSTLICVSVFVECICFHFKKAAIEDYIKDGLDLLSNESIHKQTNLDPTLTLENFHYSLNSLKFSSYEVHARILKAHHL